MFVGNGVYLYLSCVRLVRQVLFNSFGSTRSCLLLLNPAFFFVLFTAVDCGSQIPQLDPNAAASCSVTTYPNTCTATCNSGYTGGQQSATFSCQTNATWGGSLTCSRKSWCCGHTVVLILLQG